mgnify:CR=1 FL=1
MKQISLSILGLTWVALIFFGVQLIINASQWNVFADIRYIDIFDPTNWYNSWVAQAEATLTGSNDGPITIGTLTINRHSH